MYVYGDSVFNLYDYPRYDTLLTVVTTTILHLPILQTDYICPLEVILFCYGLLPTCGFWLQNICHGGGRVAWNDKTFTFAVLWFGCVSLCHLRLRCRYITIPLRLH